MVASVRQRHLQIRSDNRLDVWISYGVALVDHFVFRLGL